jgi:hypothetical protein
MRVSPPEGEVPVWISADIEGVGGIVLPAQEIRPSPPRPWNAPACKGCRGCQIEGVIGLSRQPDELDTEEESRPLE